MQIAKTLIGLIPLVAVTIFGLARPSFAWPPTYGTEYNFTSSKMHADWVKRGALAHYQGSQWQVPAESEQESATEFAKLIEESCGECTVKSHVGKFNKVEYSVKFRDGYGFNVSVDPACVEIQTEAETLSQVKNFEPRTEQFIFDIAKKLDLKNEGSAHLNIGLQSAFENDPKGFLRFFTNYHNTPELASGALGEDYANAPPLNHLKPEQKEAFQKIVPDVNESKLKDVKQLVRRIQNEVYTSTPTFDAGYHYQGISLKQVQHLGNKDRPFELRAPRQPSSANERTLLIELLEKRMAFEKSSNQPIVFLDPPKANYTNARLANQFRAYLAEMNEDWDHYKTLLPKHMQGIPPDAFMKGSINWKSPAEVKELENHLPYAATSDWTASRIAALIATSDAIESGNRDKILEKMKTLSEANDESRKRFETFREQVLNQNFTSISLAAEPKPKRNPIQCGLDFIRSLF